MSSLHNEFQAIKLTSREIELFKDKSDNIIPRYKLFVGEDFLRFKDWTIPAAQIVSLQRDSIFDFAIKKHFEQALKEKISLAKSLINSTPEKPTENKTILKMTLKDLLNNGSPEAEQKAQLLADKITGLEDEYGKLLQLYNKAYLSYKQVYVLEVTNGYQAYIDVKAKPDLIDFVKRNGIT